MSKKDGGPAYPIIRYDRDSVGDLVPREQYPGMTLRDHFAGQALAGILASPNTQDGGRELAEAVAQGAYLVADAMLAEREKE